ncbi:MAG TPA: dihydropteroate synthase, partial [bacterium]
LGTRTHIMGVINCTPDSFYAGSRVPDSAAAVERGLQMVAEGADLLDIGGESSRPGADPVSEQEEIKRVMPVVEALLDKVAVPISIDTVKSGVARCALQAGAHILNDISAMRFDPAMAEVAAQFDAAVVLMHLKGTPKNMQSNPVYEDVVAEICHYFETRIEFAVDNRMMRENLIIDPGIGFGKRLQDNYEIIRRLREFSKLERPVLIGLSRKSFIGRVLNLPPEECLEGTLAAAAVAILNGAHMVRVHDVKPMKRAAIIADHLTGKLPRATA